MVPPDILSLGRFKPQDLPCPVLIIVKTLMDEYVPRILAILPLLRPHVAFGVVQLLLLPQLITRAFILTLYKLAGLYGGVFSITLAIEVLFLCFEALFGKGITM